MRHLNYGSHSRCLVVTSTNAGAVATHRCSPRLYSPFPFPLLFAFGNDTVTMVTVAHSSSRGGLAGWSLCRCRSYHQSWWWVSQAPVAGGDVLGHDDQSM